MGIEADDPGEVIDLRGGIVPPGRSGAGVEPSTREGVDGGEPAPADRMLSALLRAPAAPPTPDPLLDLRHRGGPGPAARGGARTVDAQLRDRFGHDVTLLRDRRVARSRDAIDLLVIAPSGAWVVGESGRAGAVERRDVGGFFRTEMRLHVGKADLTRVVDRVRWQVGAVESLVADDRVPVHGAVCLDAAEWPFPPRPFHHDELWVTWPAGLVELAAAETVLTPVRLDGLGGALDELTASTV